MSQTSPGSGIACVGVILLGFLPVFLQAQTKQELDRLVFEPALITETDQLPIPVRANRLASLPLQLSTTDASDPPTALAEFMAFAGDKDEYLLSIHDIETREGAYANGLLEHLISLGSLYQQEGEHEKAIAAFERAEHVSRINHGLFDETQFPIIERAIDSFLALGDYSQAMKYQRYLIYLNEKYHGKNDLATVSSMVDLANQNMNVYTNAINYKGPVVSINVGMGQAGMGSANPDDPRRQAFGNLMMAQGNYVRAILALIENREFFRPQILELEYKFLETLFLQANSRAILEEPHYYLSERTSSVTGSHLVSNFSRRNSYSYVEGKNAFERILVYLENNPDSPPEAIAAAMLDYGDWHLLFGRSINAVRNYKTAYALLQQEQVDRKTIANIVSPAIPVQLPLITSKPNSREKFGIADSEILQPDGYIDVAFTINRYGNARRLQILGKSESTTAPVEKRLKRYLRNAPFRPRFMEGQPAKSDQVKLRYYYTFLAENV